MKQWKDAAKKDPSCRLCNEYTKISQDKSRTCRDCKLKLPRTEYDIFQWSKGCEARCHSCTDTLGQKVLSSIDSIGKDSNDVCRERTDGTLVCAHSKEFCDICMVDYTLPNNFARKRTELGRDELTKEETDGVSKEYMKDSNIRISKKICIMDGHPVCPRSSKKLRCPCDEVTYCSTACQKYHWKIHQMTCKWNAKKKEKKAKAKKEKAKPAANNLTEEQKNFARMEAFFAENTGGKHSIAECAWQLGEHPFVIMGGSITIGINGEEFLKGDVGKIFRERKGVEWDGSPRFGMGPYVQQKPREDWIAKARQGKSQRMKDIESKIEMLRMT